MSENTEDIDKKVNNNLKKKKNRKNNNTNIDNKKKLTDEINTNDSKQNNTFLHPISVLLKAIEIAQSRGAFNIEEALTISQAHKIISDDFYKK
tara:strand:- start:45 stop:323 length:279 start_codon:yes stop_codon:yes gene_type:complete